MGNRKLPASSCAALLLSCTIVLFILFHWQPHLAAFPASAAPAATMTLVHTVLFQFKADANPEEVKAAVARFIDLKEQCIHPTSSKPYILSLKGGQDNSPEGLQVPESEDQRDARASLTLHGRTGLRTASWPSFPRQRIATTMSIPIPPIRSSRRASVV